MTVFLQNENQGRPWILPIFRTFGHEVVQVSLACSEVRECPFSETFSFTANTLVIPKVTQRLLLSPKHRIQSHQGTIIQVALSRVEGSLSWQLRSQLSVLSPWSSVSSLCNSLTAISECHCGSDQR